MPHVAGIEVRRVWRHRNEVGRVHYIVTSHEGVERHLYETDDSALGRLLNAALRAQGDTVPETAQEDAEGESVPLED